jgi:hypothetical protein
VSRFLAINIEGKIGQLTVRRTSSFINDDYSTINIYTEKELIHIDMVDLT